MASLSSWILRGSGTREYTESGLVLSHTITYFWASSRSFSVMPHWARGVVAESRQMGRKCGFPGNRGTVGRGTIPALAADDPPPPGHLSDSRARTTCLCYWYCYRYYYCLSLWTSVAFLLNPIETPRPDGNIETVTQLLQWVRCDLTYK